ncbi:hypothetical protein [Roseivivax sp. CAU 1761]
MPKLEIFGGGKEVGEGLFGGNFLAHRDSFEEAVNYDELIDDLGVHTLRYPGGSITETYFDFADPDRSLVADRETGEEVDFIEISEFMGYAEAEGLNTVLVLNTRDQLSEETDEHGDRYAQVDEENLRQFVSDAITGKWGDVTISGFEIGNEYWGSGRMNATEYGRVACEMSRIVDDQLKQLEETHPQAAETDIVVQMGTNFSHSSIDEDYEGMTHSEIVEAVNERYGLELEGMPQGGFTAINNEIIKSHFDTAAEIDAVDAITAHVYSKVSDDVGEWQRSFMLDQIDQTWKADPNFRDVETHVSEWNQSSKDYDYTSHEEYGLKNAHELLQIVEEFADHGVTDAQVWPLLQWSPAAMSLGWEHDCLTPAGQMYSMMAESLPGKSVIDLRGQGDMADNAAFPDLDVHAFYGDGEAVFYFASNSENPISQEIDVSSMFQDVGSLDVQVLGVAPGSDPGDQSSTPVVRQLQPSDVHNDGYISADLQPYEIMQIKLTDFVPTEEMRVVMEEIDNPPEEGENAGPGDDPELPFVDPPEDPPEGDEEESEEDSFLEGLDGMVWAAAALPLLGLLLMM